MTAQRHSFIAYTCIFYLILTHLYAVKCNRSQGANIGMKCSKDNECHAGNGGPYSKCHSPSSTCICTVNIMGYNQCKQFDEYSYLALYKHRTMSSLECAPEDDSDAYKDYPSFFQMQIKNFSEIFVNDKQTFYCFDPKRAYNTLPEGLMIKNSTVHGSGVFTKLFIRKGTIFGPCKGFLSRGDFQTEGSAWSWKKEYDNATNVHYWIDGRHLHLSNWLRFINMAPTADLLNVKVLFYKEMFYYYAFRSIHPGKELLSFYGAENGKLLNIEPYNSTYYLHDSQPGFVGGFCNNAGHECENDQNSLCLQFFCVCKSGFHRRQDICVKDETLGGICSGSDGDLCKNDMNAECQRGVCVCTDTTSIFNGKCIQDETYGGRCSGSNGVSCLLDPNTECIDGVCQCVYGATEVDGKCMKNDRFGGRCFASGQAEPCRFDKDSICHDGFCVHFVIVKPEN